MSLAWQWYSPRQCCPPEQPPPPGSPDQSWPMKSEYSGHMISIDQSDISIQVTWSVLTNQRSVLTNHSPVLSITSAGTLSGPRLASPGLSSRPQRTESDHSLGNVNIGKNGKWYLDTYINTESGLKQLWHKMPEPSVLVALDTRGLVREILEE